MNIPKDIIAIKIHKDKNTILRPNFFTMIMAENNLGQTTKPKATKPTNQTKLDHKDEETKNEELSCCVCLSNRKCVLFDTCSHIPVCFSCSKNLKGKCPLCRLENQKTRLVYN